MKADSKLVQDMEDVRRGIRLACESLLLSEHEAVRLVLQGVSNRIGMWQSEVAHLEHDLSNASELARYWEQVADNGK